MSKTPPHAGQCAWDSPPGSQRLPVASGASSGGRLGRTAGSLQVVPRTPSATLWPSISPGATAPMGARDGFEEGTVLSRPSEKGGLA